MRIVSLLFVACVAAGCVRTARNPATGKVDVDVESPTKKGEDWKTTLAGQGQYTYVTGSAQAKVAEGMTTVTIRVSGHEPSGSHPWHIHEGKCGSGGAIIGDPNAYAPLVFGNDRTAQGSAKLSVRLDEAHDYHVNVHRSPSDMATIIACGNLDD